MAIASKTLFHFTSKFETLVEILRSKAFWPKYCCERDWFVNKTQAMFIPMVCFTDLPLSQVHEHMDFYGYYGLGLTKEWANKYAISPVWYITKKSLSMIMNLTKDNKSLQMPQIRNLLTICKHERKGRCKNQLGKVVSKNFYEEREWRYVPDMPIDKKIILGSENENGGNNDETRSYMLDFTLNDIRYILVKTEDERTKLIKQIDELYSDTETATDIAVLKSRILTEEQLITDF